MQRPRICIIGCGPAGLYSAKHIANLGGRVHIYESQSNMLSHPDQTFYNKVSHKQFQKILDRQNVDVKFNSKITPQDMIEMENQYDAFVIAIGSSKPRTIDYLDQILHKPSQEEKIGNEESIMREIGFNDRNSVSSQQFEKHGTRDLMFSDDGGTGTFLHSAQPCDAESSVQQGKLSDLMGIQRNVTERCVKQPILEQHHVQKLALKERNMANDSHIASSQHINCFDSGNSKFKTSKRYPNTMPRHRSVVSAYEMIKCFNRDSPKSQQFGNNILVIGSGNVALDCVKHLSQCNVQNIDILSRSGLMNAAFSNSSLSELFDLRGIKINKVERKEDLALISNELGRPRFSPNEEGQIKGFTKQNQFENLLRYPAKLYRIIERATWNTLLRCFSGYKSRSPGSMSYNPAELNKKTLQMPNIKGNPPQEFYFSGSWIVWADKIYELVKSLSNPVKLWKALRNPEHTHGDFSSEEKRANGKEYRRLQIMSKPTNGKVQINFLFNSKIKSITNTGNKIMVIINAAGEEMTRWYDRCLYAVGFDKNPDVSRFWSRKPVYTVGWAKSPIGNLSDIEQDAFQVANQIFQDLKQNDLKT